MKKLCGIFIAAALALGIGHNAAAIDFKASGQWVMSFGYGANGTFQGSYKGHDTIGWGQGQDNFEAVQRLRLKLDAIASESLSGTVFFEIGETTWGQAGTGGALGADSKIIELKSAYVDWLIPESTLKVRMGLQSIMTPSTASGNSVLNADVAGITVSGQINDQIGVTGFWARPYNDNYQGYTRDGMNDYRAAYMDNIDAFGLMIPITLDGVNLTPWGMYAAIGPNAFRDGDSKYPFGNLSDSTSADSYYYIQGMFPAGGARHRDFKSANSDRRLSNYGQAWWGGISGDISLYDPFNVQFDFMYGSVNWLDDGRLNRAGWFGALLLEYKLDWGTPGLYGWYGSGDDSNPANGSERLPAIDPNNANNFSYFAFDGAPYIERYAVVGNNMAGTWGIGARLNNVSFVEDWSHIFRINYFRGTNAPQMAKKMSLAGLWANGFEMTPNDIGDGSSLGLPGVYMTSLDSALELGTTNNWQVYENLAINIEAAYVFLWLDTSESVWGARHRHNETIPSTKDAWNINASFVYSF